jgi:hypothetical protein
MLDPLQYPFITVPACLDCNMMLNDHAVYTIDKRKAWVAQRLPRRFRKLLATAEWSASELAALGSTLRSGVLGAIDGKARILARINFANNDAFASA